MKKKLQLAVGVCTLILSGLFFVLLCKPENTKSEVPQTLAPESSVSVSEFTSGNAIMVTKYDLGEILVELKKQNNCLFKTTLSLGYESKKADEAIKILQPNETKIRQYIESFLSDQTPEKLKNFSNQENLTIDIVNGVNKLLRQFVILVVYQRNTYLDCQ